MEKLTKSRDDQKVNDLIDQLLPLLIKRGNPTGVVFEALEGTMLEIAVQAAFGIHPLGLQERRGVLHLVTDRLTLLLAMLKGLRADVDFNGMAAIEKIRKQFQDQGALLPPDTPTLN